MKIMKKYLFVIALLWIGIPNLCLAQIGEGVGAGEIGKYVIHTDKPEQYIWGLGFEIQSDAIASGNAGLPEEGPSVPHDLVESERKRFYKEMLVGFRYCRIAGGLYFRGTTPDRKELYERWDTQIDELREMIHEAGIEGISLEYWSPAPYWKANNKYEGRDGKNYLRCFDKNFKDDIVYKGDTLKFLSDFGSSLVNDIFYFEKNDIPVKMWGLQNEPSVDQNYSSCKYTVDQYTRTFSVVAPIIKSAAPHVMVLADSESGPTAFAKEIAKDPLKRCYVDAWVWHQIGVNSNRFIEQRDRYWKDTYGLPVFQNEYEYLTGGTSPQRCLNTVQNIMNWFTFVNSPTWFWIHALKPLGNSEASGYSLGFWKPKGWKENKDHYLGVPAGAARTINGIEIQSVSPEFITRQMVSVDTGTSTKPGRGFSFQISRDAFVYLIVDPLTDFVPDSSWKQVDKIVVSDRKQRVYVKDFKAGLVEIPENAAKDKKGKFGIPHAAIVVEKNGEKVSVKTVGGIRVEIIEPRKLIDSDKLKEGHWTFNNYNWFALVGFLKHMPWNSRRYFVEEDVIRKDQRILAFQTPEKKWVYVITNRSDKDFTFNIRTFSGDTQFKGYRYTLEYAGKDFMGEDVGVRNGDELIVDLPPMSWDFWVEQ